MTATTNTSKVKTTIQQAYHKRYLTEHTLEYTAPNGDIIEIISIKENTGKDKTKKPYTVGFRNTADDSEYSCNTVGDMPCFMSVSIPPAKEPVKTVEDPIKSTLAQVIQDGLLSSHDVRFTSKGIEYDIRSISAIQDDGKCSIKYVPILNTMQILSARTPLTTVVFLYPYNNPDTTPPKEDPVAEPVPFNVEDLVKKLKTLDTREEGYQILDEFSKTKDILESMCRYLDIPTHRQSAQTLREKIVQATIGFRLESKTIRGENTTNFNDLTAVVELVKDFSNDSKLALINLLILQMSDPATSPNTTTNPAPTKVDTNPANNPKPVTATKPTTKPTTTTNDEDRDKSYESLYPALCEWKQLRDSGKTIKSFSPEQSHGAGYASIVEELKVIDWLDGLHPSHKSQILERWKKGEIKFSLLNGICKPNYHVHYPSNATLIALGRMEAKSQGEYKAAIAAKKSA